MHHQMLHMVQETLFLQENEFLCFSLRKNQNRRVLIKSEVSWFDFEIFIL